MRMSEAWHEALSEDAVAMANAIVTAMLDDPDGTAAYHLIRTIAAELTRDLPPELVAVLDPRCTRPAVIIEYMAEMVVDVIRAAERRGLPINRDALASPYLMLVDLEDPDS